MRLVSALVASRQNSPSKTGRIAAASMPVISVRAASTLGVRNTADSWSHTNFSRMEPVSTLREVNRLLKHGGIFATIDYDWPPVMKWEAEQAYQEFQVGVRAIEAHFDDIGNTFVRYDKSHHLASIKGCGHFQYTREILFASRESCTQARLLNLPFSLGGIQTILKLHPDALCQSLSRYQDAIRAIYSGTDTFTIDICYRMRMGIKL